MVDVLNHLFSDEERKRNGGVFEILYDQVRNRDDWSDDISDYSDLDIAVIPGIIAAFMKDEAEWSEEI